MDNFVHHYDDNGLIVGFINVDTIIYVDVINMTIELIGGKILNIISTKEWDIIYNYACNNNINYKL